MNYEQQNLFNWLTQRSCLKLACIEKKCNFPKGTLRHFTKSRRGLSDEKLETLSNFLSLYGYIPLDEE